jgi:ubiquinone/menaquinone biosynthesis C-methylase UbiE
VADSSAAFVGSIPELYDRHLGPLFFEAYARDLAARLAPPATPRRVLELACGTGIATRRLRERLARDVTLVATDLNEGMLAVARVNAGAQTALTYQQADASSLPFADAEHAAVVCQFGWMFFPDKPRAAREALRVLAPGGQLLFSVWDSLAENPVGRIAHETLTRLLPADPPDFYRVRFGFHDRDAIRARTTSRSASCAGTR